MAGALSDDARLTSVSLLHTSGLSREQRGLGRLKLAQPTSHVTWKPLSRSKGQRSTCRGGAYCGDLPYSLLQTVTIQGVYPDVLAIKSLLGHLLPLSCKF